MMQPVAWHRNFPIIVWLERDRFACWVDRASPCVWAEYGLYSAPTSVLCLVLTPGLVSTNNGSTEFAAMECFEYNSHPARVIFGSGSINKLPDELARLKLSAPLVLSTPEQVQHAQKVSKVLGGKVARLFSNATMHTPVEVTEKAMSALAGADSIVSIGGGSTIGLGKAVSIRTGLPHICIPTTYAGSEMTPILGESAEGRKTTRSDPKILPGTVIYDVDLTMTLPAGLSATSGVNAIAHAGESSQA
jgi:alcohol dehydrogenase class IV